jgi:hypothetical protein
MKSYGAYSLLVHVAATLPIHFRQLLQAQNVQSDPGMDEDFVFHPSFARDTETLCYAPLSCLAIFH